MVKIPNWCDCNLTVSGKKADLDKFKEAAKGKEKVLDENKFIPYPQKWREMDKGKGNENKSFNLPEGDKDLIEGMNGYDWCRTKWGTKWGITDPNLCEGKRTLWYNFQCAWSPCEPLVIEMSKQHPTLKFKLKYWEAGMCFKGVLVAKEGKPLTMECDDYHGHRGG